MKKTLGIAALALIGFVTLTGFRGGCGRPDGRDPAAMAAFVTDRVDDALDDLDATDTQRAQVMVIKDRMLAEGQKLKATREATHEVLRAEWASEKPDAAKLHALVDARAEEMKAMAHQAVDAAVEVHAVLTPEQRAKLAKKAERFGPRHH